MSEFAVAQNLGVDMMPLQPPVTQGEVSRWTKIGAAVALASTMLSGCSLTDGPAKLPSPTPYEQWHKAPNTPTHEAIGEVRTPWGDLPVVDFRMKVPTTSITEKGTTFVPTDPPSFDTSLGKDWVTSIFFKKDPDGTVKRTVKFEYNTDQVDHPVDPSVSIPASAATISIAEGKHTDDTYTAGVYWNTNVKCTASIGELGITTSVNLDQADTSTLCNTLHTLAPYLDREQVILEPRQGQGADEYAFLGSQIVLDTPFEKSLGQAPNRTIVVRHEAGHAVWENLTITGEEQLKHVSDTYADIQDLAGKKGSPTWQTLKESSYYKQLWNITNNYGHPYDTDGSRYSTEAFASFSSIAAVFPEEFMQRLRQLPQKASRAIARFGLACFESYKFFREGGKYRHHRVKNIDGELTKVFPDYRQLKTELQDLSQ
ncbi:MAG TPA: hypothetical protein VLH38_03615 [Patescibacteria group bacterium]|nr:hypothetical protein [Patescibacteria group bacterium]